MSTSTKNRATFHSRLGFILVSAGCAVGLGNVWKFPYICGENGGGAFLIIYLLCLLLLGLPIVICEFAIGRGSRRSISQALNILEQPGSRWHITKYAGIAGNYLLMMFYTMVAGWMLYYAFLYGSGKITAVSAEETSGFFSRMLDNPGLMILFAAIVIVLCIGICALGLQNGIEKITKVMMMLLIVLMLVLVVNSLRLKGAGEGLKYFLVPSFSRLKENGFGSVAFAAMTHAFFTLSVGIGAMEIFGSYLKKGRRITGEAINVVVLDTCVAIMAGLIIIPACFSYGVQPDAGPSLLFITLPNVFHHMVGGRIWGCCFFVFMSFAALSTVISKAFSPLFTPFTRSGQTPPPVFPIIPFTLKNGVNSSRISAKHPALSRTVLSELVSSENFVLLLPQTTAIPLNVGSIDTSSANAISALP